MNVAIGTRTEHAPVFVGPRDALTSPKWSRSSRHTCPTSLTHHPSKGPRAPTFVDASEQTLLAETAVEQDALAPLHVGKN